MTKIYDGAGIYTVSFGCSGMTIELTQDEINEILEEETDKLLKAKEALDKAVDIIEDLLDERE